MNPRAASIASRVRDTMDWPLLITTLLIAVVGVVNLYSATSVAKGGLADLYVTQVQWMVLGGICATAVAAVDYGHFERLGYVI
jgi:rod shape determining protein RodA